MECRRVVSLVVVMVVLVLRWPGPLSSTGLPVSRTITVDGNGGGDFRRVQSAVNFVPDGNREWVRIHVRAGSYTEKVTIPAEKGYILLEGEGSWKTDINFHAYADPHAPNRGNTSATYQSATFTVLADDFVARNIAFKNTHNARDKTRASQAQAVAALVSGDRNAFYGCAFHGFQDMLCDDPGRHYFSGCFIEGAIDFIFGYGQSIYDGCTMVSNMPASYGRQPGWVTAHRRDKASDPGGFVFKGRLLPGEHVQRGCPAGMGSVELRQRNRRHLVRGGWVHRAGVRHGRESAVGEASERGGGGEVRGHELHRRKRLAKPAAIIAGDRLGLLVTSL